jgi:site-specific DNA recombinase
LRSGARTEGQVILPEDEFIDDGVSGGVLVRPALERLRDQVAEGSIDVLFVLSPDRLARKYAYQALLLEEFKRSGVEVIFLNHSAEESPEGELLLQVQGVIAEYEKAKILERSRRGKLHKARNGAVSVLSTAPYGYVYLRKAGAESARLEVIPQEAETVRKIFGWFVYDHLPVAAIARRLKEMAIPTREGLNYWSPSTVWYMLKNPAYKGQAAYGKTKTSPPERHNRRSRLRLVGAGSRHSTRRQPRETWIAIDVPAIVSEEVFEVAQGQLEANKQLSLRNSKPGRYLLRGLLVCAHCSYALCAITHGKYQYYRCHGTRKAPPFSGMCSMKSVHSNALDEAVWLNIKELLSHPARVTDEYERRLSETGEDARALVAQRDDILRKRKKTEAAAKRLLDAYEAGALSLAELKPRKQQLASAAKELDDQAKNLEQSLSQAGELREIVTHLSEFSARLQKGLDDLDFDQRLHLTRLLVKRIEVSSDKVTIVYKLPPTGHG